MKSKTMKTVLILVIGAAVVLSDLVRAHASPGNLDLSFGSVGIVSTAMYLHVSDIAIQRTIWQILTLIGLE